MNRHRFYAVLITIAAAGALTGGGYAAESGTAHIRLVSPSSGPVPHVPREPVERQRVMPVTRTAKVALMLPLTGRHAEMGKMMQDAATVALFDKYARMPVQQASTRVDLLVKDTGDTPQQAAAALRQALEAGAEFVIGPLFAESTAIMAPIAAERKVNILSFSNHTAQARPGVYMYGFSPQEQTVRVVSFAYDKGKSRIAALVPDSSLGTSVVEAANAALDARGTELVAVARYAPQGVGVDKALAELMPNGTPHFDALLLPEGGPALPTILRALDARGVRYPRVQLLGTGIWDDATLVRTVNLEGAWLASSPPSATALFEKRFMATYGYQPQRLASLAYDAVSFAVALATSERGFSQAALTNTIGFTGPGNGNFRLRADGKVERALAVLEVGGASFRVIDLAPTSFTGPAVAP